MDIRVCDLWRHVISLNQFSIRFLSGDMHSELVAHGVSDIIVVAGVLYSCLAQPYKQDLTIFFKEEKILVPYCVMSSLRTILIFNLALRIP